VPVSTDHVTTISATGNTFIQHHHQTHRTSQPIPITFSSTAKTIPFQNRTRAPFFGKSQPANKTQSAVPIFSATHHGFIQIKPSPSTLAICRLT
jgi:hypothetical protein